MWYILLMCGLVSICTSIAYCLGYWYGKRKCMIEHHILFGKDADEFERRAREAEEKMGLKL